ncbi:MAG: DUF3365 domain-containing protein [Pseudomonadota bacterium]|nr:DUF3365 domain-containing protein [Pseudomonadota bacterium]
MKKQLISALLIALPMTAIATTEISGKHQEARLLAKEFLGQLKPELGKAMKSGGPVHAVEMCHSKAPKIAQDLTEKSGWNVNRVSLKPRAKTAYADSWETETLKWFDQQAAAGKDIKKLEKFEVVKVAGQDTIRYMKAIPAGGVCLTCHGEAVAKPVTAKIGEFYPHDTATGYQKGQVRGAFSFQQAVK